MMQYKNAICYDSSTVHNIVETMHFNVTFPYFSNNKQREERRERDSHIMIIYHHTLSMYIRYTYHNTQ